MLLKGTFKPVENPKRGKDWTFSLSEELINMIDHLCDIVEKEGGKPPQAGCNLSYRQKYYNLLRDIQVEARSSLWKSEKNQNDIIRYYSMEGMFYEANSN